MEGYFKICGECLPGDLWQRDESRYPEGWLRRVRHLKNKRGQCAGALELLHNRNNFSEAGWQARRALLIRIVQSRSPEGGFDETIR